MKPAKMTREKHLARHKLLHQFLDELIADWLSHNRQASIGAPILDLMRWSHKQTIEPTEVKT